MTTSKPYLPSSTEHRDKDPGLLPYDCSRCRNGACLKRSDCLRWLAGIPEIGRTPIILCDGDGIDCRYFIPPPNRGD